VVGAGGFVTDKREKVIDMTSRPRFILNSRGVTYISTLVAAAIIVVAIGGLGASAMRLGAAIKKAEVANLAVAIEANLSAAFLDKANYPDPTANPDSPNAKLRAGTLTSLPLHVSFLGGAPITIPVPVSNGTTGAEGFLDRDLLPCPGFNLNCVLHYQVRLKKFTAPSISYAFSYQVDANPEVLKMAPLGAVEEFSIPLDPGNYRAEMDLTHCDAADDLFVTGVDRDSGAVLCAKKPALNSCPPRTIAKGLKYVWYPSGPVMELDCTQPMRTYSCKPNYALQTFNAQYIDPDNHNYDSAPGKCVFLTARTAVMKGSYPPTATPYMKSVSGTFCPPYYTASSSSGCNLVPDANKNTSSTYGLGKCAPTRNKNCHKPTYTNVSDGGSAHNTWVTCNASATPPAGGCGPEPANPVITTSCSSDLISNNCNGTVNSGTACQTQGEWDQGTPYADTANAYTVYPSAIPKAVVSGRKMTCTYQDTSTACNAPDTDYNGNAWGKKSARWYGGVQVQNVTCNYDSGIAPEVINAN
jgi:type II secretory pathway pseudopilin PulG